MAVITCAPHLPPTTCKGVYMINRRDFIKGTAATVAFISIPSVTMSQSGPACTVYTGGPILTMNAKNDIVEAIAIKGNKILATGKKTEVLAIAGEGARVVDLNGKTLLPGFIDGHSHFPGGAAESLTSVKLGSPPMGDITCIADLQAALKARAKATPEGQLVLGTRYNDLAMKEQRHPTREDLDAVSTRHPIIIRHVSGHAGVANSRAFEMAKVTASTTPPEGVLRVKNGKLTGLMEGRAQRLLDSIPRKPVDYAQCIPHDSETYASNGVTTANNGGSPTIDDYFLEASDNGNLKIRVVIWPAGMNKELISSYGEKRSGAVLDKKGKVILGGAKLFADGSPQGYTALFSKPYFKQMTGKSADYRGFSYFESPAVRFARVKELHDAGWQITTHTNGDQAIQDMLDAYGAAIKANPRIDARHILNHCQFNRPDQVPVIAELGLIPSYFVTHTLFWGDVHREFVAGPEMAAHISPCNAALAHGIQFALHNDTPVTPISPLTDVFSAVNRITASGFLLGADQRISVMDALRGVTINAARMYFLEKTIGSLEPGKLADMVILEENPLEVNPQHIKDINISETIVDGETVYKA